MTNLLDYVKKLIPDRERQNVWLSDYIAPIMIDGDFKTAIYNYRRNNFKLSNEAEPSIFDQVEDKDFMATMSYDDQNELINYHNSLVYLIHGNTESNGVAKDLVFANTVRNAKNIPVAELILIDPFWDGLSDEDRDELSRYANALEYGQYKPLFNEPSIKLDAVLYKQLSSKNVNNILFDSSYKSNIEDSCEKNKIKSFFPKLEEENKVSKNIPLYETPDEMAKRFEKDYNVVFS